jgi:hypothetical protein
MNIEYFDFDKVHHLGENATRRSEGGGGRPRSEPLATRPGVLLRLAGSSLRRCRAYPDSPPAAHSGVSN